MSPPGLHEPADRYLVMAIIFRVILILGLSLRRSPTKDCDPVCRTVGIHPKDAAHTDRSSEAIDRVALHIGETFLQEMTPVVFGGL